MNLEASTHDGSGENSGIATDLGNTNGSIVNNASQRSSSRMSLSRVNCDDDGTNDIELQRSRSSDITSRMDSSWSRQSLSFCRGATTQSLDDKYESEIVSQAGDIGDRALQSNRNSESGSCQWFSMDNVMAVENGFAPPPEEQFLRTYGFWFQNRNGLSTMSPVTPLPSEIVSPLSTDAILYSRDENRSRSTQKSSQPVKENQNELPIWLEYIACLVHLAVFGILGMLTRYLLQKLFGPTVADVTSDKTALYLDLPSNMVGSFLMGWLGVVFKPDISRVSDFLAIGLSTGYLGSLTTFSGWNQKMLDLSVKGKWVVVAVECLIGMFLVSMSIIFGIQTAKGFRWLLKQLGKEESSRNETPSSSRNWWIDNFNRHLSVLVVLLLILSLLWGVSGNLLRKWVDDDNSNDADLWLGCMVAPLGVWIRWFLARLNGRGLGRKGVMKWMPFGTLIANVSAASMMAGLATVKKVVNTERCEVIATGIQFGFLGCLSTVSTFIAEYHAMSQSKHPWRAHVYAAITILPSFGLGTLIYSVPVWMKGYQ
ncbi:CrcB-like protein [Macleaya cordata]|uniref:CrcB-like protein n=1 Tax=Macleaya cordata TaxID=56857 RepID=A0A200QMG5_MACCD|nr:CrcB-like protein [Macleaya cordata]